VAAVCTAAYFAALLSILQALAAGKKPKMTKQAENAGKSQVRFFATL
jgi:hypothetical protein